MTAYVAIPNGDTDPESPIKTGLIVGLRDNPIAMFEKAAGAPVLANDYIVAAMVAAGQIGVTQLGNSAVHTPELSKSTGNQATTAAQLNFAMAGGFYAFLPQAFGTAAGTVTYVYGGSAGGNAALTGFTQTTIMGMGRGVTGTASLQWKYINASPPYDMGDGIVPVFIFAAVDANGDVVHCNIVRDPHWLANGPTDCEPDGIDEGGSYQFVRQLPVEFSTLGASEKTAAVRSARVEKVYLTQAKKHADMDLLPHPYVCDADTMAGMYTPVLIDPVGPMAENILELFDAGEDVCSLFIDKHIKIDNNPLIRKGPSGLMIAAANWKL